MLEQERSLEAATEVFGALEADTRRVVLQRVDRGVAVLLALGRDVQAAVDGDVALGPGGVAGRGQWPGR
jgi:hypothetical protein